MRLRARARVNAARTILLLLALTLVLGLAGVVFGPGRSARAATVTTTWTYASYPNGSNWTVPYGVTSISIAAAGGAGGRGGNDGYSGGAGGVWGLVTGNLDVTAGTQFAIYPGGSGANGSGCVTNSGGGAGGTSSYSSSYNGGWGGNSGWQGCSGGGGGGGAATLVFVGGTLRLRAAGAGGGGGGSNRTTGTQGSTSTTWTSYNGSGNTQGGGGAYGGGCGSNDGGGGGGGGGGFWSGAGGTAPYYNGECYGVGGYRADNNWTSPFISDYTTSTSTVAASAVKITFTHDAPSTPDMTDATDTGSSSTDNVTKSTTPVFRGTATGGSTVQLFVDGVYNAACGTANVTTGAYSCTAATLAAGSRSITVKSTYYGDTAQTTTSSALSITVDTTAPTATWTAPSSLQKTRSLSYTLTFSESINGLTASDLTNAGTATGCSFTPGASTGTTITVSVACTSDGTVIARLLANGVADTAGNTGPTANADATSVTIDATAPTATITTATRKSAGQVQVKSSETGTAYLVSTNITVTNVASITGSPTSAWNSVTISAANTDTSLDTTRLAEGTYKLYAVDAAGNLSVASTGTLTLDNTAPTATWTAPSSPAGSRTLSYSLTFSESISGLTSDDFTNTGTATGCTFTPSASTGTTVTVSVTCTSDGTVVARLMANGVSDVAGNTGPTSNANASSVTVKAELTVTYDSQGGSSIASGTTMVGGAISASPGTPTYVGYTFLGWSATSNGTVVTFPWTHGKTDDFTMYARWSANTLTVSYDSQGGTPVASGSTVTAGRVEAAPGDPTRAGYTFDGWSAPAGGSKITFPWTHGKTSNFTLYARWSANTLSVTWNTGGGSTVNATSTTTGASITSPPADPTRPGYTFEGWSATSDGSVVSFPWAHGKTADFTVHARWSANTLTVTWNTSGGSAIASTTTTTGSSIAVSPGTPLRAGYTFDGWYLTEQDGVVTFPWTHGQTGEFTMYAKWTAKTLTITFESRGGSSVADGSTVTGGSIAKSDMPADPTRTGYTFDGWSATINGPEITYPYAHGKTANFALYARWIADPVTVTYDVHDGSIVVDGNTITTTFTTTEYVGGAIAASPGTPTREGYVFGGWSASTNGWPVKFPFVHNRNKDFTMHALWRSRDAVGNFWFYPGAGEATTSVTDFPSSMTPAFPRSTVKYHVRVAVTSPVGVDQINTVSMCWYKTGIDASTTCDNAANNPETEFKATWFQADDTFTKSGVNNYSIAGSNADKTNIEATVDFAFRISNAMSAGDWKLVVTVTDNAGVSSTLEKSASVDLFASVTTRAPQSFGVLPANGVAVVNNVLVGEYTTNHAADFSIEGTNFRCADCKSDGSDDLVLVEGAPGPGEVALACSIGASVDDAAIPVTGSTGKFGQNLTETGESPDDSKKMSCRLRYGGGVKYALEKYSNEIQLGIGPRQGGGTP